MKKILSLALVGSMILSSMSMAFAATPAPKALTDIVDSDYKQAIETLVALDIVNGYEDGTFKPGKTVTRAEMAKLLVETLGYGDLVAGSKSNFTDTKGHWADSYVAIAAGKGIVLGTGNGTFTPDRAVSYDEAITMVVRALGYTEASNEIKSMTWPTNYKVKAAELDLTDDVAMSTAGADRGGVAQLIYNALEAILVTINSDGDVVKSYSTDKKGEIVYNKLLTRLATFNDDFLVDEDVLDEDSKDYAGNIVDLTPYMYQNLDVYVNEDDEVVYVDDVNSVVVTGSVVDVLDKTGKSLDDEDAGFAIAAGDTVKVVIADANGKEYKVPVTDEIKAYYNEEEETIAVENFANLLYNDSAAKITAIITDTIDNGKFDSTEKANALVVAKATQGILVKTDYADGKSKITGVSRNITLPVDDGDVDAANITVTGAVDSLTDIAEDDVVIAYEALNYSDDDTYPVKLVVVRDSVDGTITKTNDSAKTVYIDGKVFKKSSVIGAVAANVMAVNNEGTFYLDNAGKIFAIDTETELVDYAVVIGAENGKTKTSFLTTNVDDYAQLKLATAEGETIVSDILTTFDDSVIDDVATLTLANGTEKDLVVKNGTALEVDSAITTKGTLVKYSVDEDGYIDEIEIVATETETIDTDDLDVMTTDATVVFDATDDYNVVSLDNLEDGKSHTVAYFTSGSDKGKIAVIVSSNVESVNDGVYGVISDLNYAQNASGSKVVEVTALVDGKEVTYLTGKSMTISDFDISTSTAVRFTFNSSDVLTGAEAIVDGVGDDENVVSYINKAITDIDSDGMKIAGTQKYFASDVAVYIYDLSDDEITIGDTSDLLETGDANYVTTSAYVIDKTDSSRIGVIVQYVK